jgi:hypothetical protein
VIALARICPFGGIPYRESPVRMGAEVGWNEPLAASVRCLACYSLNRRAAHAPECDRAKQNPGRRREWPKP